MVRFLSAFFVLLGCVLFTGCGPSTVKVSGKISVDNAPLDTGNVAFHPANGNDMVEAQIGRSEIKQDGSYSLWTDGKEGAIPGKYKVVVLAGKPSDPKDPYSATTSLVDKKFTELSTTPLEVEVSASAAPGTYDLKVTK